MIQLYERKSQTAFKAGFIAILVFVVLAYSRDYSGIDTGGLLYESLLILNGFLAIYILFQMFKGSNNYGMAKGYSSGVGILLFILGPIGWIVLRYLKDKSIGKELDALERNKRKPFASLINSTGIILGSYGRRLILPITTLLNKWNLSGHRLILAIAALFYMVTFLFPPWIMRLRGTDITYSFILSPPEYHVVYISLLLVEWAFITIIAIIFWVLNKN